MWKAKNYYFFQAGFQDGSQTDPQLTVQTQTHGLSASAILGSRVASTSYYTRQGQSF